MCRNIPFFLNRIHIDLFAVSRGNIINLSKLPNSLIDLLAFIKWKLPKSKCVITLPFTFHILIMDTLYTSIFLFLNFLQNANCAKYYCPMMIAVDETFYIYSKSDITNVTKIARNLVDRVNQVYSA